MSDKIAVFYVEGSDFRYRCFFQCMKNISSLAATRTVTPQLEAKRQPLHLLLVGTISKMVLRKMMLIPTREDQLASM